MWLNSSIWPQNGTLSGTSTPGLSGPESGGNEGVIHIPQTLGFKPHRQMPFLSYPSLILFNTIDSSLPFFSTFKIKRIEHLEGYDLDNHIGARAEMKARLCDHFGNRSRNSQCWIVASTTRLPVSRKYKDCLFVAASHQTGFDTRSKARRPMKVGIKGRGRSGTSRDSNPAGLNLHHGHLLKDTVFLKHKRNRSRSRKRSR